MKGFFGKLFNIYPGEEKSAMLFALLGLLWSFAITAGLKFADALFLLHVGASQLPTVYKLTACGMVLLATLLLSAFNRISIHKILVLVLTAAFLFYAGISFCLAQGIGVESKSIWYSLRIAGSLFFAVMTTCFWTFVDHYHHLQDAKRLYSLFSSMVFIGVACTGVLMNSGWMTFQQVVFLIMVVLVLTIALSSYINRSISPVPDEHESIGRSPTEGSWWLKVKSVLSSRFTLMLMTGNFLTYVLLVLTEFNYMSSFDETFDPEGIITATGTEQNAVLTHFLGQWIAIVSVSNLIIGLFLYSRFVRRFGIGSLVFCTPLILLVTFSGWILSPSLIFPIMGLFVVEGTLYVIDDSNFNLLLNAVPTKFKYKIRLFIESFFEPSGMLVSSFLLSIPWLDSKILGLILAICLLTVVIVLRRNYLQAIYRNLAENAIHFERKVSDWFFRMSDKEKSVAKKRMLAILRQGEENLQSLALQGLLDFENPVILEKTLRQVDHLDELTKRKCVEALSKKQVECSPLVAEYLHKWIAESQDKLLKGAIHLFLAKRGKLSAEEVVEDLTSDQLTLKGAAMIALKKSQDNLPEIAKETQDFIESQDEEKICMGIRVLAAETQQGDVDILISFLKFPSIKVARAAAEAMAEISPPLIQKHTPTLISFLTASSDSEIRLNCLKALGKVKNPETVKEIIASSVHFRPIERRQTEEVIASFGESIVPSLLEITKNSHFHDRCRVLGGRILGRLDLALLRNYLQSIIANEVDRAFFYYYYSQTIQATYPYLDLHILQDALLNGYHSVIDFIIQLLGVAGELEDCELLSRSLHSPHPKVRSHALEMLERSCETKIFRSIAPLITDLPKEEKLRAYRKKGETDLSLDELLDRLEHSSITVDQIVAATLKCRLNVPNWKTSLMKRLSTNSDIFQPFAQELLDT